MDLPTEALLLGSLAIVAVVVILIAFATRARPIDHGPSPQDEVCRPEPDRPVEGAVAPAASATAEESTQRADSTPAARREATPIPESRTHQRECLASAFAEQIEDVLRTFLLSDPLLARRNVDLGTAEDGSLEIIVDGETYSDVSLIPDEGIRKALEKAVANWQAGKL
jgi:hypothetical protein